MSSESSVALIGGAPDTGNRGVTALGDASVANMAEVLPGWRVCRQSWGQEILGPAAPNSEAITLFVSRALRGRQGTRHLQLLRGLSRIAPHLIKRLLERSNATFARLLSVSAILDIAGGDSFADVYGPQVFSLQADIKRFALQFGKPLVLLPQTFGPYTQAESRAAARDIIARSSLAATRELGGLDELRVLFGGRLPSHVVVCPDVAFTLRPIPVDLHLEPFLIRRDDQEEIIGINVSGLLVGRGGEFGLGNPYADLMLRVIEWAASRPSCRVVLVPHVWIDSCGGPEMGDNQAIAAMLPDLVRLFGDRVSAIRGRYAAGEIKYLIGQCDFFIGARMHACIAAVSQAVPTITMAYSKKAAGVMGLAGQQESVLDLSAQDSRDAIDRVNQYFEQRAYIHGRLHETMPEVQRQVRAFFSDCLAPELRSAAQLAASGRCE